LIALPANKSWRTRETNHYTLAKKLCLRARSYLEQEKAISDNPLHWRHSRARSYAGQPGLIDVWYGSGRQGDLRAMRPEMELGNEEAGAALRSLPHFRIRSYRYFTTVVNGKSSYLGFRETERSCVRHLDPSVL